MSASKRKKVNNGLIVLNKSERTAVINLLTLICLFLGFSLFRPAIHLTRKDRMAFHNLDSMLAAHSLKTSEQPVSETPSYPQTERHTSGTPSYDAERSKKDGAAKRPYTTSASGNATGTKGTSLPATATPAADNYRKPTPHPLQLNTADSTELIALPQIGEVMASRIHRYRDRLGGYVSLDQLFEVKGMDSARFETIRPYLLLDTDDVRRLQVNQDDFKTLLRHPYLEYEQVKAIVNHRERRGLIQNWEQLRDITGEVNPRLQQYVTY